MYYGAEYYDLASFEEEKKRLQKNIELGNGIVKLFNGKYIDIDKVVSISEPSFIDRMGHGGFYVGFDIEVQLLEKTIEYEREFEYAEYQHNHNSLPDCSLVYLENTNKLLAVERLKVQIDDLIGIWLKHNQTRSQ